MDNQSSSITIVGAGPVGLMCAIYAIKNNLKPIIISLDEKHQKTAGVAAGGMLAPAYECFEESSDDLTAFAIAARNQWDIIANELGIDIAPFALALGNNQIELERLEKIKARAKTFGFDFKFENPHDFLNCQYALSMTCDGLLNPIIAMEKMRQYCVENGATFIEDEIIDIGDNIIIGKSQNYNSEIIIVANGYHAKDFAKSIQLVDKLIAVRGQVIEIDCIPAFKGSMRHNSTYLMARGNKIMVGATSQINDNDWQVRNDDIDILYQNACHLMPSLKGNKVTNSFAGLRPLIDGENPIIGQGDMKNIYLAIGAYRNGWAFAPYMAKLLIENIAKGADIPSFLAKGHVY